LVPPESSSAVLVMIRSKYVSISNVRSHARLVDAVAEIARFQGVTKFDALVRRTP